MAASEKMGAAVEPRPLLLWPEGTRRRQVGRREAITAALIRLEDLRTELVAKLDLLDDDPDLEPSLGSLGSTYSTPWADQRHWAGGPTRYLDLEDACEDEGAQCDDEGADDARDLPSVSYISDHDQTRLAGPNAVGLFMGAR